jgi:hypothetical protein
MNLLAIPSILSWNSCIPGHGQNEKELCCLCMIIGYRKNYNLVYSSCCSRFECTIDNLKWNICNSVYLYDLYSHLICTSASQFWMFSIDVIINITYTIQFDNKSIIHTVYSLSLACWNICYFTSLS